ncbi:MAG TPA: phosphatidylglycerophosphatase A [Rubrivivax sp.]|nr:phosphatidylglycerophosphatase A [Rubrivivax sp.]
MSASSAATLRFMLRHPAHLIALGFGSGLAPRAPGTAGTLAAWAAFVLLEHAFGPLPWLPLLAAALLLGVWACTVCARHLGVADPGAIVWDEVIAFWAVLWLIAPAPWLAQGLAFALFRLFDAVKPGPVGWADRLFKPAPGGTLGWAQGFGILFDDLVAAACTLALLLPTRALWS